MYVKIIVVYIKIMIKNKLSFLEYLSEGSKCYEIFCSLLKEYRKIIYLLLIYKMWLCIIYNVLSIFVEWIVLK